MLGDTSELSGRRARKSHKGRREAPHTGESNVLAELGHRAKREALLNAGGATEALRLKTSQKGELTPMFDNACNSQNRDFASPFFGHQKSTS